jgi:2-(3-amino-3-carboxypropyl)histidine synthase
VEKAIKKLKELKVKRVFIQYPEGIKNKIQDITNQLEKEGFEVIICTEPCYGSCDIRDHEAKLLKCDAILHIGHEDYGVKSDIPVVYWEYFIDVDPLPALKKEIDKLKDYKKIGLITSLQFVNTIPIVKDFLEKTGKKVFVHKALQYPGQILGCNLDAAKAIENKIDCFLCISAGEFYGFSLAFETDKPMLNLDLEKGTIESLENEKKKVQKIIVWNKSALKDAKKVGILISWKLGQLKLPFKLKEKLEKEGKEVYLLAMDEVVPEKLMGLKIDFLINTACPRIGIDDLARYKIPLVNIDQIMD